MTLVTFTPDVCTNKDRIDYLPGCEYLVAYARILNVKAKEEEAILQFTTTLFTCFVLTIAFLIFSHDTEVIVI